jgi:hypothetical protein
LSSTFWVRAAILLNSVFVPVAKTTPFPEPDATLVPANIRLPALI